MKNSANPKEVKVSNLTDKSFTVSWITDKKTEGSVILGQKVNRITTTIESQQKNKRGYVHTAEVRGLTENTDYYFIIISDSLRFTDNQKPWHVKTAKSINSVPISENIAGRVIKKDGTPAENTSVYVSVNGSSPLSTLTNSEGLWIVNLGLARNQTNDGYIKLIRNKTPIEIYVQSGIYGITYARATFDSQNILEPMMLGEVYIFNPKQSQNNEGELLEAKLIL